MLYFLYNPTLESIPNKENLCRNYPLPLLLPPPPIRSNTTLKAFQAALESYLSHLQNLRNQNEPAIVANVLAPFLQSLGLDVRAAHKQKGKSEIDLALLKNNNVEVIIEAKKLSNKEEMFSPENVNCRALHECILYYLRERDENLLTPNTSLTYIIITDFYQFYIFKSSEFKRLFESRQIKSLYKNFTEKKGLFHTSKSTKNEDLYAELKKILSSVGFLDSVRDSSKQLSNPPHTNPINANPSHTNLSQENPPQANIEGYYFDLRTFDSLKPKDKAHIATLLSPEFLHDERTLDPNAISEPFYRELLHILGLTEKEQRKIAIDESQENSFAKHIFYKLEQKIPKDSLLDSMMNLIIIWLNRILFLKLIESKLLEFNDNDTKLCFLTSHKIKDFATLEHLFFEVLAKNYDERQNVIDRGFHYLPYLNSSLFSKDEIETRLLSIGTLDSSLQIAYYPHTILQDREGKAKTGKTTFLAYLFDFLNSYAFGLESSKRDSMKDDSINNDSTSTDSTNTDFGIDAQSHSTNPQTTESTIYKAQSHADSQTTIYHTHTSQTNTSHYTSKTIIKSSVLGSVFERLNGYKEGSFYTPSFITNYMCKEVIDKAVVEKFNTQYGFKATNLAELQEDIKDSIRSQRDKTQKESTRQEFKKTLLSLTLCDPSVGSGHFLVSALNYLVFIHWYLKLALQGYEENSKRHSYDIEDLQIIDDEIILLDSSYSSISYTRPKALNKAHRIQKELFTLKKEIIESCLFGVDINPISCHIAQLRLWIELLKSTYYTDIESHFHNDAFYHSNSFSCHSEPLGEESIHTESSTTQSPQNSLQYTQGRQDPHTHRLETLPNIDINIKEGNSLLSYIDTKSTIDTFLENMEKREMQAKEQQDMFAMQELESFKQDTQKKFYDDYKKAKENSNEYKNAKGKEASLYKQNYENHTQRLIGLFRRNCDWYIDFYQALKDFFYQYGYINLTQLEPEIRFQIESYVEYFDFHKNINFERKNKREIDSKKLQALLKYLKTYEDAQNLSTFEWRFAFPEVLDSSGDFVGFDLIIGNPPYIKEADNKKAFENTKNLRTYQGKMDIWYHFVGKAFDTAKTKGIISFIATNNWTTNSGAKKLRNMILTESKILSLIDFGSYMCFENASIQTMIMTFQKLDSIPEKYPIYYARIDSKTPTHEHRELILKQTQADGLVYLTPTIKPSEMMNKPITFADSTQEKVLEKIQAMGKVHLEEKEVAQGIVPNPDVITNRNINENLQNMGINIGDGVFVIPKNTLKITQQEKQYLKPLFEVEHCNKYHLSTHNTHEIIYTTSKNCTIEQIPNIAKHLAIFRNIMDKRRENINGKLDFFHLHWARDEKFFKQGEKILSVRKCIDSPIFSYTNNEAYVMLSINIIQTNRLNMKYLTGVLNSKLVAFWLRYKGKMQGSNYQVDKEPLMNIPLVAIDSTNQNLANEIIALVEQILESKAIDSNSDTSELESQIDKLVYKLYNLNESEINIIEN